ncbi:Serine/threonine-protein kinase plk4 [Tyrophagus putrescentiae]|nr:Serine/threonine-protein kinase plk4 [Tyrophagus putrescentiae]
MSFTRNLQNYLKQNNHTSPASGRWSNSVEDYEFLEQIGAGSFGQVFKAKIDGSHCAVKRICKAQSPNISKILSEVFIHIRLSHQHILQLFNVLEDRNNVYLVMEMCHGGSLSHLISRLVEQQKSENGTSSAETTPTINPLKPVLPYVVIGSVLRQLCSALEYLHRNFIIHRDLNLNNILLVKSLTLPLSNKETFSEDLNSIHIKLADYGLAIDLNQQVVSPVVPANAAMGNTICGTPGFISPEIWKQLRTGAPAMVSPKSDIYSLGSILFACIAGYTPSGNIELTNFLPMTTDLITQLLEEVPEKRPSLNDILEHIFVSGRIDSTRLLPIEKTTKNIRMSIDKSGTVELCFLQDKVTILASADGSQITVKCPNTLKREYSFYELPQSYWKRYGYLTRFIRLIKSKTAKITIHCEKLFKENSDSNNMEYISRGILMENGDFEVTLFNKVLKEDFKFKITDQLPKNLEKYKPTLEVLQSRLLDVEREFTEMKSAEMNKDHIFPISCGFNDKICELLKKKNEFPSVTQSQILKSMKIDGIGLATQFSNGSIKVNFKDGSNLSLDNKSQIFYIDKENILRRFNKDDILPEVVLQKIARMPQVIDHLRGSEAAP